MTNRYIDMASVALREHYDMEEAHSRAAALYNGRRETTDVIFADREDITEELLVRDAGEFALDMAIKRMNSAECWWDTEDPKQLVIEQLSREQLFFDPMDIVAMTEEALGRPIVEGEASLDERWQQLNHNRARLLAELKGEEYVEPEQDPMDLLSMLFGGQIPPQLQAALDAAKADPENAGIEISMSGTHEDELTDLICDDADCDSEDCN